MASQSSSPLGYLFGSPAPFIDSDIFSMLSIKDTVLDNIIAILSLLLLPTNLTFKLLRRIGTKIYEYKPSDPKLMSRLEISAYLLNVIALPIALLQLINQINLISVVVGVLASFFVFTIVNFSKVNSIVKTKELAILQLDEEIDKVISSEKNLEKQRIKVESLLALKRYFSMFAQNNSFDFLYATLSAVFLSHKLYVGLINPTAKRYRALEEEKEQMLIFLAKASA